MPHGSRERRDFCVQERRQLAHRDPPVLVSALAVGRGADAAAADNGAASFISQVGQDAIESLTGPQISDEERERRFREILIRSFEVEVIARSFMNKIEKILGPTRDIPAPDVNTNAQVMAWMMDEYGKLHGHTPAICTGKPIALEGSYGREQATGRGCVYMFREAAPQIGLTPAETSFVVQGYGNVGSWAARIMQQLGCKMVGASDATGAIRSDAGIDAEALTRHIFEEEGQLTEFAGAEVISPDDLLAIDCDVFIPAALGGMIHEGNADRMDCKVIVEGANSPMTPHADKILHDKGVFVIPDVMANAGGVVVSYFEWVQNLQHFRWSEREVNDKLGGIMRKAYRDIYGRAREERISLREASYLVGIERVVEASRTRGLVRRQS